MLSVFPLVALFLLFATPPTTSTNTNNNNNTNNIINTNNNIINNNINNNNNNINDLLALLETTTSSTTTTATGGKLNYGMLSRWAQGLASMSADIFERQLDVAQRNSHEVFAQMGLPILTPPGESKHLPIQNILASMHSNVIPLEPSTSSKHATEPQHLTKATETAATTAKSQSDQEISKLPAAASVDTKTNNDAIVATTKISTHPEQSNKETETKQQQQLTDKQSNIPFVAKAEDSKLQVTPPLQTLSSGVIPLTPTASDPSEAENNDNQVPEIPKVDPYLEASQKYQEEYSQWYHQYVEPSQPKTNSNDLEGSSFLEIQRRRRKKRGGGGDDDEECDTDISPIIILLDWAQFYVEVVYEIMEKYITSMRKSEQQQGQSSLTPALPAHHVTPAEALIFLRATFLRNLEHRQQSLGGKRLEDPDPEFRRKGLDVEGSEKQDEQKSMFENSKAEAALEQTKLLRRAIQHPTAHIAETATTATKQITIESNVLGKVEDASSASISRTNATAMQDKINQQKSIVPVTTTTNINETKSKVEESSTATSLISMLDVGFSKADIQRMLLFGVNRQGDFERKMDEQSEMLREGVFKPQRKVQQQNLQSESVSLLETESSLGCAKHRTFHGLWLYNILMMFSMRICEKKDNTVEASLLQLSEGMGTDSGISVSATPPDEPSPVVEGSWQDALNSQKEVCPEHACIHGDPEKDLEYHKEFVQDMEKETLGSGYGPFKHMPVPGGPTDDSGWSLQKTLEMSRHFKQAISVGASLTPQVHGYGSRPVAAQLQSRLGADCGEFYRKAIGLMVILGWMTWWSMYYTILYWNKTNTSNV